MESLSRFPSRFLRSKKPDWSGDGGEGLFLRLFRLVGELVVEEAEVEEDREDFSEAGGEGGLAGRGLNVRICMIWGRRGGEEGRL